ncbi:MAG TPA: hypothetical protein VFH44_09585 [Solirubrobacterales bacterium]|nr:hypothetical protein [Solirubrobacterales bacterium]
MKSKEESSFAALDALGAEFRRVASEQPTVRRYSSRAVASLIGAIAVACFIAFSGPGQAVAEDVAEFVGIDNPEDRPDVREINEVLSTPGSGSAESSLITPTLIDRCAELLETGGYNIPCIEILGRDAPERLPQKLPEAP